MQKDTQTEAGLTSRLTQELGAWWKKNFSKKQRIVKIVTCQAHWEMQDKANELMRQGWKPLGGMGYMAVKTGGNKYDHEQRDTYFMTFISV
jgi:hypothetical protein